MGEVVNLRRVKRQQRKAAEATAAAENRARHGRTAAERDAEAKRRTLADRTLDGARKD